MPRNMSFSMTTQSVRDRIKDVTRRNGWKHLKPGELFWAVEKAMGLKPGEKVVRLALCRCKSNTQEPLAALLAYRQYGIEEVSREGLLLTPEEFCTRFIKHMGGNLQTPRQRIHFEYVDDPEIIRQASA